jgi:hypothetical protein
VSDERPVLGLSASEAAEILGLPGELYVYHLIAKGRIPQGREHTRPGLDREDVEQASLERLRPGRPHRYWATSAEAACILGVTQKRVCELAVAERLPAVRHAGRWYFRRHQVHVIANARRLRSQDATAS